MRCSKGTYIRTLLEDIAAGMGQLGAMSALRRTQAGLFTEAGAHTLEEILAAKEAGPEALAGDGRYRVRDEAGQFLGLAQVAGGVLRVEKLFVERT